MSAGNTVADDPALTMTAPGSQSVLPVPDAMDRLPQPELGGRRDRTVLLGAGGRPDATPAQDGGAYRPAGAYDVLDGWQGPPDWQARIALREV